MKSDPYWKTSKEVFYYLPYSNKQKPAHLKVICFCAEFFCFISQALALTTLLSAKLRGLGETGIESCLNLLLGEVLKFPHSGAGFQTSNIYLYFTSFLNPFQFFHVKLFFFFPVHRNYDSFFNYLSHSSLPYQSYTGATASRLSSHLTSFPDCFELIFIL